MLSEFCDKVCNPDISMEAEVYKLMNLNTFIQCKVSNAKTMSDENLMAVMIKLDRCPADSEHFFYKLCVLYTLL